MVETCATGTVHSGQSRDARGSEWDLIEAAQRGDRDAFGRFYARYRGEVSRFVRARTRDRVLAEDVTSETFLRAWRGIGSVSYQGRDAGAWLTVIARRLIADHLKSSRHRRETTTAEFGDRPDLTAAGPEQAVIDRETARATAEAVRRCVAQLSPDQQECLRLRFSEGLSVAETAAVMGREQHAAKSVQHRAIVALRAALAGDAGPVPRARDPVSDGLVVARRAVEQVRHAVEDGWAGPDREAAAHDRAQQLARWHTADQATARQHAVSDASALAGAADGDGG